MRGASAGLAANAELAVNATRFLRFFLAAFALPFLETYFPPRLGIIPGSFQTPGYICYERRPRKANPGSIYPFHPIYGAHRATQT